MIAHQLTINPSGEWSPRKAAKVLEIINPEAQAYGLRFTPLDISTFGGPKRVLLIAECLKHGCVVEENSVCPLCIGVVTPSSRAPFALAAWLDPQVCPICGERDVCDAGLHG